jgi:arsenite methyltransferase
MTATVTERDSGPFDLSCCSDFYEQNWVRELLEENFHPGGENLTRRSVNEMGLPGNSHVVDLGCGTGSSALMIAGEYPYRVSGMDPSALNVKRARERQQEAGPTVGQLQFLNGNAANLPFRDNELDAILAECSFSLVPDQAAALAEIRRVLRPGGLFAISDMAVRGTLPEDIAQVIAPWTCLVNAHDRAAYKEMFEQNGFELLSFADESDGLNSMISSIKRKLVLLGTGMVLGQFTHAGLDLGVARHWLARIQEEVDAGRIRYLRFHLTPSSSAPSIW